MTEYDPLEKSENSVINKIIGKVEDTTTKTSSGSVCLNKT